MAVNDIGRSMEQQSRPSHSALGVMVLLQLVVDQTINVYTFSIRLPVHLWQPSLWRLKSLPLFGLPHAERLLPLLATRILTIPTELQFSAGRIANRLLQSHGLWSFERSMQFPTLGSHQILNNPGHPVHLAMAALL